MGLSSNLVRSLVIIPGPCLDLELGFIHLLGGTLNIALLEGHVADGLFAHQERVGHQVGLHIACLFLDLDRVHHVDQSSAQFRVLVVEFLEFFLHHFEFLLIFILPLLELLKLYHNLSLLLPQPLNLLVPVLNHEQQILSLLPYRLDLQLHVLVILKQTRNVVFTATQLVLACFGVQAYS